MFTLTSSVFLFIRKEQIIKLKIKKKIKKRKEHNFLHFVNSIFISLFKARRWIKRMTILPNCHTFNFFLLSEIHFFPCKHDFISSPRKCYNEIIYYHTLGSFIGHCNTHISNKSIHSMCTHIEIYTYIYMYVWSNIQFFVITSHYKELKYFHYIKLIHCISKQANILYIL
jgi:hypothetical protein